MRISTRSQYGLRLMLELGLHYGMGYQLLKGIAERQGISATYLSQIVIPLKAQGLINAERGARGGYRLMKDPAVVTVKDIVEVLEGDLGVVECLKHKNVCERVSECVARDVWHQVRDDIANRLQSITIADLITQCKEKKHESVLYHI